MNVPEQIFSLYFVFVTIWKVVRVLSYQGDFLKSIFFRVALLIFSYVVFLTTFSCINNRGSADEASTKSWQMRGLSL